MQYANINFDLAVYLVQLFSGQPFHEYCIDHIFTPITMTHTGYRLPDLPIDDVAIPSLFQNRSYEILPYYQLLHYPIEGLMTTVDDLSHSGLHTRIYIDQSENTGIICFFNSDRSTYMKKFVSIMIQHLLFAKAEHLS